MSSIHITCTYDQAQELIAQAQEFYICNCGCRESSGHQCQQSRLDVCLAFVPEEESSGSGTHKVDRAFAEELMQHAKATKLVTRPWRNTKDPNILEGICFCCQDCCEYFTAPEKWTSDKGTMIETTDMDACTQCGACVDVCYFNARSIQDGILVVDRDKCYGCGLCVDECPIECITMINR